MRIETGDALESGASEPFQGSIQLQVGAANLGRGGEVAVSAGTSKQGRGGDVSIASGDSTGKDTNRASGGAMKLYAGDAAGSLLVPGSRGGGLQLAAGDAGVLVSRSSHQRRKKGEDGEEEVDADFAEAAANVPPSTGPPDGSSARTRARGWYSNCTPSDE